MLKNISTDKLRRILISALCVLFAAAAVLWMLRLLSPDIKKAPAAGGERRKLVCDGVEREYLVDGSDFIIDSRDFAPDVKGFAGPLRLSLRLDPSGRIKDFSLIESSETDEYLERAMADKSIYLKVQGDVAVSGATFSSTAISKTLKASAGRFMEALSKAHPRRVKEGFRLRWDFAGAALLLFAAMALTLRRLKRRPPRWGRRIFLFTVILLFGVAFQLQLSMDGVANLLLWRTPEPGLTGAFILFALPLPMLLFGNFYCGWLCPFGALQELLGDFALRYKPPKRLRTLLRLSKYFVLAGLLLLFLLAVPSPFAMDANGGVWGCFSLWPLAALLLSLISPRLWCRNLCPTGAFLSLFNKIRMKRLAPPVMPGRCAMGVSSPKEADCLNCDRCRDAAAEKTAEKGVPPMGPKEVAFACATALIALAIVLVPLFAI